jgi:hypothetical protein
MAWGPDENPSTGVKKAPGITTTGAPSTYRLMEGSNIRTASVPIPSLSIWVTVSVKPPVEIPAAMSNDSMNLVINCLHTSGASWELQNNVDGCTEQPLSELNMIRIYRN